MNKQISLLNSNLNRVFNSPLSSFVDEFFSDDLPLGLIDREDTFPKYNIYYQPDNECSLGYDKNKFIVELALTGYSKNSIEVYTKDNTLYVEDISQRSEDSQKIEYLYKGISNKQFKWWLKLPKFSVVKAVTFVNGLLKISIQIEKPEKEDSRVNYDIKD